MPGHLPVKSAAKKSERIHMKRIPSLLGLLAVMIVGILSSLAIAQGVEKYSPVTSERLLKPEPENWLMYRGTYDGWGFIARLIQLPLRM